MNLHSFFNAFMTMPTNELLSLLGNNISFSSVGKFFLGFLVIVLGVSLFSRLIFGRQGALSRALGCSTSILLIYVLTVIIYILRPWSLERLLSPLPFVAFCGEALVIHPFEGGSFSVFSGQAVSLIILSALVLFSSHFTSRLESPIRWLIANFLSLLAAMLLHLVVNYILKQFLPNVVTQYGSAILFSLLLLAFMGGIFKIIIGFFLANVSPLLAFLYTFFFANRLGKVITTAILASAAVILVLSIIEYFGYAVIMIGKMDLLSYIPLLVGLLGLWYLIGHEL